MPSLKNRTSANALAYMTIDTIAPAGFYLDQFSTDAGVVADAVQEVQADMTLDGHLLFAYTPNPVVVNVTLAPTSPSLDYLRQLQQAQRTGKEPFGVGLTVTYPATGKRYVFSGGAMTSAAPMPGLNRAQEMLTFQFTFEKVE